MFAASDGNGMFIFLIVLAFIVFGLGKAAKAAGGNSTLRKWGWNILWPKR